MTVVLRTSFTDWWVVEAAVEVDIMDMREDRMDELGVGDLAWSKELDLLEISGTLGGVDALGMVRYVFFCAKEARFPDLVDFPLDLDATDRRRSANGVRKSSSCGKLPTLSATGAVLERESANASSSESEERERILVWCRSESNTL